MAAKLAVRRRSAEVALLHKRASVENRPQCGWLFLIVGYPMGVMFSSEDDIDDEKMLLH